MFCFDDVLCFIEDVIELLLCIITQSIVTMALTVGVLMGTMMYLNRQYRLEQSLRYSMPVINMNTEGIGPMPMNIGTNGAPMNQHTRNVPHMPSHKIPEGNSFLL